MPQGMDGGNVAATTLPPPLTVADFSGGFMQRQEQKNFITLFYKRGQRVLVTNDCKGPACYCGKPGHPWYGLIETEAVQRPGWYYVRHQSGYLDLVHWAEISEPVIGT